MDHTLGPIGVIIDGVKTINLRFSPALSMSRQGTGKRYRVTLFENLAVAFVDSRAQTAAGTTRPSASSGAGLSSH